jgi:DNA-binding protein H-NS
MATASKLSELLKQKEEMQKQIDELIAKEKKTVIETILKQMDEYGITTEELGFSTATKAKKAKAPQAPKVITHKRSETETWNEHGRGQKPKWVKEILAKPNGEKELEKYKV